MESIYLIAAAAVIWFLYRWFKTYTEMRAQQAAKRAREAVMEAARREVEEERERLMIKYKDRAIVDKIFMGEIWIGQTEEQLLEAQGRPDALEEKVTKAGRKKTYKYLSRGSRQYTYRVTVEDGEVTAWDQK